MFKSRMHALETIDALESAIKYDGGIASFVWEDSSTWRTLPTVEDLRTYIAALAYTQGARAEWVNETDAVIYYR